MAEERIFVEKVEKDRFPLCVACWTDGEDYFCSWGGLDEPTNKEICEKKCPYDNTISRQEAIERIVKAFVNLYIEIEGTGITYTAKEAAEAALNALLEEK